MTELIRAAGLGNFPELAQSVGLNYKKLMAAVGIDHRALEDPEMRISGRSMGELLELAALQSNIDTFGLRMAETRSLAILGPIGLLLREEPTARHAILSLVRYISLHNEAVAIHIDEVEDQTVISLEFQLARPQVFRQSTELATAVLFRVLQSLIGRDWQPIVCFAHEPPARLDVHYRVLGSRVDFRCNYNGIILASRYLDRALPGANPVFAGHARRYLDSLIERKGYTLEQKVRQLVRVQLSSGRCTVELLARQLGCDRRTLHRRLAQVGVTFDEIQHAVRCELAVRLLQNRSSNLAAAADMLGFSSPSAFSRWFLGAFGKRPSQWRNELGYP